MSTRINLGDLKSQITKRVGLDRAQRYFTLLSKLISQKLSKPEFNKHCVLTIGRENLPLHNQLIRSIFNNACEAKTPPSVAITGDRDGLRFTTSLQTALSNGDISPPSPKRPRSGGRKIKDRLSPLGPNGRIEVVENGYLGSCDLKRPLQHGEEGLAEQPAKKLRRVEDLPVRLDEAVDVDGDREEFEQRNDLLAVASGPLRAPLGIPFCPLSVGGARRPMIFGTSAGPCSFSVSSDSGELCHSEDLKRRMERIAEAQGVEGVTLDCANLLNNGLDAYLRRLIKSCTELIGARSGNGQIKQPVYKQQALGKPINGVWQGNHMHVRSVGLQLDGVHDTMHHRSISLQDFRVAMELNPKQLGEDWPLLLEKICLQSFEE